MHIKCILRESASTKTNTELQETGLRSSEGVKVTSHNPHLAHTQEVEGNQPQLDSISSKAAFTEAISTALYVVVHVPVQVAYSIFRSLCAYICTVLYLPRN
jgi:hypothetical protein